MATAREAAQASLALNRRARFDYAIEDTHEGGLVLMGSEVKSLRAGKVDLVDAYLAVERGEIWLKQLYIAPFEQAKVFGHEPRRARKVLLHRREIEKLQVATMREGYTLIPLRIYLKGGNIKVEIGVAKGKSKVDKRQDIAKKVADREARAAMGRARKGNA